MSKKIIFSGGGTGGHIFPAINLMKHFFEKKCEVLLVTDNRGCNFIKNYSIKGEKPPVAPSSVCIKEVTDTHNLLDYNLKTIKKDIYKTDNINFIHKGKLKFY